MKIPNLSNSDLAYETGLHIGDGCLSQEKNKTYRFGYYGNNKDERKFFTQVIIPLMKKLYGFDLKLKKWENTCFVRVCSKELLCFKANVLGLPVGNKSAMRTLPKIFMNKEELAKNLIAGLFDTDGSVYKNRNKYPRISLSLKNKSIIEEVQNYLNTLGIKSIITCNNYYDKRIRKRTVVWNIEINGFQRFYEFLKNIPLRNPKNLEKIKRLFGYSIIH